MAAKYRADHIGSFLRPAELLQARNANIGGVALRALEDKHILQVLERQRSLGFKIFTDGELRRGNFMSDLNEAVEGIDEGVAVPRTWHTGSRRIAPSFDGARHGCEQDQTNSAFDRA